MDAPLVPRRRVLLWSGGLMAAVVAPTGLVTAACSTSSGPSAASPARPSSAGAASPLPPVPPVPSVDGAGTPTLAATLSTRRSVRDFTDVPLTRAELGLLLWAAQGVTAANGHRTAPSAGALYALELYATTAEETLHYLPDGHRTEVWAERSVAPGLARATRQDPPGRAPTLVVVTVTPARLAGKYGGRAGRYADLEAGHATQNLLLQAVALGLGAVPIGSFDDGDVAAVLGLPEGEEPRYVVPVGHPR